MTRNNIFVVFFLGLLRPGSTSCGSGERDLSVLVKNGKVNDADHTTHADKSDAYVIVKVGGIQQQTKTDWNDNHPEWNKQLNLGCVSLSKNMVVKVKDEDVASSDDLLLSATWSGWSSYPYNQDMILHDDDDDGSQHVTIAIVGEEPTSAPTHSPTHGPTHSPTHVPTHAPTTAATPSPSLHPTFEPTQPPTQSPTTAPSPSPSPHPSPSPSPHPTWKPTLRPTLEPSHYPTPLPTVLGGDPPDWAHSTSKTHKGNTLAIVLPIVLILGAVSMGGALWIWRQGLTRDQTNVFNRYRSKFTSELEGDEETTVYTAPALISEMINVVSGDREADADSSYVSLSGDVDDDNDAFEESTYTL